MAVQKAKGGIPKNQHPNSVTYEKLKDQVGYVLSRVYTFTRSGDNAQVIIREHSLGHKKGDVGPHFNTEVRQRVDGSKQPLHNDEDHHSFFEK